MIRGESPVAPAGHGTPSSPARPEEGFVRVDGRMMYCIPGYDRMPPFLMSIVSDSDLWMFISSYGGLTAGRVDEDHCLFPYQTDDRLHRCQGLTGPITLLRVWCEDGTSVLWEPFTDRTRQGAIQRNLYKSVLGDCVVFEEINPPLGLTFRYRWSNGETLGFVRTCTLIRHEGAAARVELLDGLLDLLPSGIDWLSQQRFSCLVNAYTRCEVDAETNLGIVAMTSLLTDKAEPAEALRATVVWSTGLEPVSVILSADQLRAFREGRPVQARKVLKGTRGAYLVGSEFTLGGGESRTWHVVADVNLGQVEVQRLRKTLDDRPGAQRRLEESLEEASARLLRNVAGADGLQATADGRATAHHLANVLFNNMRGGVFVRNYDAPGEDFAAFVRQRNRKTGREHQSFLSGLTGEVNCRRLMEDLRGRGDADLLRLGYEYLPLTFSRRHGDPSRPWNRFTIRTRNPDGSRALDYQGNWRDIFQNWEALCLSFPEFLEGVVAKFVNASTIDGFNPYRLSRAGIDWEVPAPNEPWANLGYWGDHQIVYLLKFLEASRRYHPGAMERLLDQPIYTYANVPYRIRPYEAILRDSRATIEFDHKLARLIDKRVKAIGSDGRLTMGPDGRVYHVCLAEKLLVSVLARLCNLVVDGGIWMNTQRPEWNDANNALAGSGLSVVTLCYLRRYLAFCIELLTGTVGRHVDISSEVLDWCHQVDAALRSHRDLLNEPAIRDEDRKALLDRVGVAFSQYRCGVYAQGFSGKKTCEVDRIADFFRTALDYVDHGIRASRRPDGLYHAYNLLDISADGRKASIGRLYEMLEGQVAALSSGLLSAEEAVSLLRALRASRMYRADQDSFLLYPDRELPGFLQKNRAEPQEVESNPLLVRLLQAGSDCIIARDAAGEYRFNSGFRNAKDVQAALESLAGDRQWREMVKANGPAVLQTYERAFNHRAFTGRSGTMYGYEGLGCIYWHMVAKLLLAAQECFFRAVQEGRPEPVIRELAEAYYQVRAGLGFNKSAEAFGAFPTDPYSHTPGHAGAQQPGMTGQVKEEIITRLGELGVMVEGGRLTLDPVLLRRREFLQQPCEWTYIDLHGEVRRMQLRAGTLAFTFCQVPIVYEQVSGPPRLTIAFTSGTQETIPGNRLDARSSASLFGRSGGIRMIQVSIPPAAVRLE